MSYITINLGNVPTLMKFLVALVSDDNCKPLLCVIACMILKHRSQRMSLVQRVISVLLYGNGTHKKVHVRDTLFCFFLLIYSVGQVYNALHPLMICISHSATIKLIDRIASDYDILVHQWSDNLMESCKVSDYFLVNLLLQVCLIGKNTLWM